MHFLAGALCLICGLLGVVLSVAGSRPLLTILAAGQIVVGCLLIFLPPNYPVSIAAIVFAVICIGCTFIKREKDEGPNEESNH